MDKENDKEVYVYEEKKTERSPHDFVSTSAS